jgi:hypothetical protein
MAYGGRTQFSATLRASLVQNDPRGVNAVPKNWNETYDRQNQRGVDLRIHAFAGKVVAGIALLTLASSVHAQGFLGTSSKKAAQG